MDTFLVNITVSSKIWWWAEKKHHTYPKKSSSRTVHIKTRQDVRKIT